MEKSRQTSEHTNKPSPVIRKKKTRENCNPSTRAMRQTGQAKKEFLACYPEAFTITEACKRTGVTRGTFYSWLRDPEFAAGFEDAKQAAIELLEQACRERATREKNPSDVLAIFMLKGAAPDKYRERIDNRISGEVRIKVVEE